MTDIVKEFLAKISKAKHKYCGTLDENGFRIGSGCQQWFQKDVTQKYSGQFLYNNLQNKGIYLTDKKGDQIYFDGLFYANKLEGYGKVVYADTTVFEGLFKQHIRFGPGVLTYPNNTQDVGIWEGFSLRRIAVSVGEDFVPRLGKSSVGKARLLKYRSMVSICGSTHNDPAKKILTEICAKEEILSQSNQLYNLQVRNINSLFFDKNLYCSEQDCTIDVIISQKEFEEGLEYEYDYIQENNGTEIKGNSDRQFEKHKSSCTCFQSDLDRFGHISVQLHDVELRLRKLSLKKQHTEEQIRNCKYCCDNIFLQKVKNVEAKKFQHHLEKYTTPKTESKKNLSFYSTSNETEEDDYGHGLTRSEIELQNYLYTNNSTLFSNENISGNNESFSTNSKEKFSKATLPFTHCSGAIDNHLLSGIKFSEVVEDDICIDDGLFRENEMNEFPIGIQVCYCNDMFNANIDILRKILKSLKQEEHFYRTIKINLENHLDLEFKKLKDLNEEVRFVKKVVVTDLLAWNNEELWINMLQHCFRHRFSEDNVSFNVKDLLIGHRHYFKNAGVNETNCKLFLEACSEGIEKNIFDYVRHSNVNVDLCDCRGNTGLMLATIRDKVNVIALLANFGAKLDVMNDEGLTPLTISFLKYLSFKFKVNDWEMAFLPEVKVVNEEIKQWRPTESLLSIYNNTAPNNVTGDIKEHPVVETYTSYFDELQPSLLRLLPTDKQMPGTDKNRNIIEFNSKTMMVPSLRKKQMYVFNMEFVRVAHDETEKIGKNKAKILATGKKSKKKVKAKKTPQNSLNYKQKDEEKQRPSSEQDILQPKEEKYDRKLETIKKTILTLLCYGSNPNVGEVPLKSIFLAIFTDDSDFMNSLLENNADPNITISGENLTSLHIIVTQQPSLEKVKMCEILLKFKADPNIKTYSNHWSHLKSEIIGKDPDKKEIINEGKNVLHLLCLREDFIHDPNNFLGSIANILVVNGCRSDDFYLGHTPLSLAVFRGNVKLIESMLRTQQVDPHLLLGNQMGNVLTVLILNRYRSILSNDVKKEVAKTLLDNGLNPLNRIGEYENTVDFIDHEQHLAKLRKVSSKKIIEDKSKVSLKASSKKTSKQLKKSKTFERNHNKNKDESIECYIIKQTRRILFRHLQGQAVRFLYNFVGETLVDPLVVALARFVSAEEALKIIQLLFQYEIIEPDRFSFATIYELVQLVRFQSSFQQNILDRKIEEAIKKMSWKKMRNAGQNFNLSIPEIDENLEKYRVCFQCLKSEGKNLLKCPNCELIYFCSEECNVLNNESCIYHSCKIPFYNAVKNMKEAIEPRNRLDILLEMANKIRDEKIVMFQLMEIGEKMSEVKHKPLSMQKQASLLLQKIKKMESERENFAAVNGIWDYKFILKSGKQSINKMKLKSVELDLFEPKNDLSGSGTFCKINEIKSSCQLVTDIYKAYSGILHSDASIAFHTFPTPLLDFEIDHDFSKLETTKYSTFVGSKTIVKQNTSFPTSHIPRHPHKVVPMVSTTLIDQKPRRQSSAVTKSPQTSGRIDEIRFITEDFIKKPDYINQPIASSRTGDSSEKTKRVADKGYYMELLSKIFADFNLPLLLLPYACFKDGQVYYSMSGNKSYFGSGFHKLNIPD